MPAPAPHQFGLVRFAPPGPVTVLYIQEEDARALTRARLRRLIQERCGDAVPDTLHVSVRRGINLDDPVWVERIIGDMKSLDVRLLILDAARRLSSKTDEGPAKVRELTAILRSIVTRTGASIVVVHHDVKPSVNGQDLRRRGHQASGGDWFAAAECPVQVERISDTESLVYPQDYKFSMDPAPFSFICIRDELTLLIKRLVGRDVNTGEAERAGARAKLLSWLAVNSPTTRTEMKKAGFGWDSLTTLLDDLLRAGMVETVPGRTAKSVQYRTVSKSPDASQVKTDNAA